jgi:DNA-binding beta-propeller fold protein YncE
MTTRILRASPAPLLAAALLFLAGCATPGPLHVYTAPSAQPAALLDAGGPAPIDVPTFLAPGETLTGLAYDPFTDHLFLRLAPGNVVRVVDRPARAIKRTYTVATLPPTAGGDLAVRPRDGHIFFTHPSAPALVETDRFGAAIRTIPLAPLTAPPTAVAYDPASNHLLVLTRDRLTTHTAAGALVATVVLDRPVAPAALAYDPETREVYAPLPNGSVGVFNLSGQLVRTLPGPVTFLDLGPRSLLRLF